MHQLLLIFKKFRVLIIGCLPLLLSLAHVANAQKPVIDNISKITAAPGSVITINGSGFSSSTSNLKVWFGAAFGEILNSSDYHIDVKVPAGATYGEITVLNTISGLAGNYKIAFTPSFGGNTFDLNKLEPAVSFSANKGLYDLCMCDFDGDGKNDMAAANTVSYSVSFYRNTSTPAVPVSFEKVDKNISAYTINTACADLDGDGKPDVIFSKKDGDRVYLLRNTSTVGSISFSAVLALPTDGNNTRMVKIKDLDMDGKPDIILTNQSNSIIYTFLNKSTKGNLFFATHKKFEVVGSFKLTGLDVEDLNGDGLPEIVVSPLLENNIYFLKNKSIVGNIDFESSVKVDVSGALVNIAIADLNKDNKSDIIVTKYLSNHISIFLNTTSGVNSPITFSSAQNLATTNGSWGVDLGDVDGDGLVDFAISAIDDTKSLTIFRNTSTSSTLSFEKTVRIAPQKSFAVVIGDVTGDGRPDFCSTGIDEADVNNNLVIIENKNCMVPVLSSENQLVLCSGSSVKLNATSGIGVTYSWKKDGANYPVSDPTVPNITTTTSGTYQVTATIGSCIQTSNALTLSLAAGTTPATPSVLATSITICPGETLTLGVNSPLTGATYYWKGPSNYNYSGSLPTINIPNVSSEHAGKYYVSVKVGDCQSDWAETTVQVSNISSYNILASGLLTLCSGKTITLSVNHQTGNTYVWKKNSTVISGATTNSITESTDGSYSVVVTNSLGCTFEATPVNIKVVAPPVASFTMPSSVCKDTKVAFKNTSSMAANTTAYYIWTFGDGNTSAVQDPEKMFSILGDYAIKLVAHYDDATCSSEATKTLKVTSSPTVNITASKTDVCEGDSVKLSVNDVFSSVLWSNNNTTSATYVKQSGSYTVEATTSEGCSASNSISVSFLPAPPVKITANRTAIGQGESVRLTASGAFNYTWLPADIVESPSANETLATPNATTVITLKGEDISGCVAFDSVRIDVDVRINIIPAKFITPNGDTKNEKFHIGNIEEYPDCTVLIYNRQGHKIYEAKPYNDNNAWDGTSNGKYVASGVYYYVIRCGSSAGNTRSGSVTLIK